MVLDIVIGPEAGIGDQFGCCTGLAVRGVAGLLMRSDAAFRCLDVGTTQRQC